MSTTMAVIKKGRVLSRETKDLFIEADSIIQEILTSSQTIKRAQANIEQIFLNTYGNFANDERWTI